MGFKRFDMDNCISRRIMDPLIRFYRAGNITFNSGAIELMNIDKSCNVGFYQDEESSEDLYLVIENGTNGFNLRYDKKKTNKAVIQSAALVKIFFDSICVKEKSCGFKLVKADVEVDESPAFLIITCKKPEKHTVNFGSKIDETITELKERQKRPYNKSVKP